MTHTSLTTALSSTEASLWAIDQMTSSPGLHALSWRIELTGHFDRAQFVRTWQLIVGRHPALRNIYEPTIDGPRRRTRASVASTLHWHRETSRDAAIAYCNRIAAESISLERGPLVSLHVVTVSDGAHHLLLRAHHIVFDEGSLEIILGELTDAWQKDHSGNGVEDAYHTFLEEQDRIVTDERGESMRVFWKEYLADAPARLTLPGAATPTDPSMRRSETRIFSLSENTVAHIRSVAARARCTAHVVVQSGVAAALGHWTATYDLVLGIPVSARSRPDFRGAVGMLVNTLPLRVRRKPNDSFLSLVRRVRNDFLEITDHAALPFAEIAQAVTPRPTDEYTPVFQVLFASRVAHRSDVIGQTISGARIRAIEAIDNGASPYEVAVTFIDRVEGASVQVEVDPDRFVEGFADALCDQLRATLDTILRNPDDPLAMVLPSHSNNGVAMPGLEPLHLATIFEQAVEDGPLRQAVVSYDAAGAEHIMTYAQLNERAELYARILESWGVGPDQLVAIALPRSAELLAATLGTLKVGAGFVPLDVDYPRSRLKEILSDARPHAVVTEDLPLVESLSAIIVDPRTVSPTSDAPSSTMAGRSRNTRDVAYVIFTSGSTGRPKGVVVSHQGIVGCALSQSRAFTITHESRVAMLSSVAFDAAIGDLMTVWFAGAAIVLPRSDERMPGPSQIAFLRRAAVTHMVIPPAALALHSPDDVDSSVTVIVAGENCSVPLARSWSAGHQFFNAYGPTETTVVASLSGPLRPNMSIVPLGEAVDGGSLHVLDEFDLPVATGVIGELHVGGPSLARGYLNDPARTADVFVPNPFSSTPGERMYATGDLVRRTNSGELEFIGRKDRQIKVRGNRVELAEIEHRLAGMPGVAQCVVRVRPYADGEQRIIAWITSDGTSLDISVIRRSLADSLPAFSMPTAIVLVPEIPLNSRSKVDDESLPDPPAHERPSDATSSSRTERAVIDVWREILPGEPAGLDTDLFEIGAHSLTAVRIAALLTERLGREVPISRVFRDSTPRRIAAWIEAQTTDEGHNER